MEVGALSLWARFRAWCSSLGLPPEPFQQRACQGSAWRLAFPQSSKQDIRDFLDLFVSSFSFRSSSRLHFAPSDPILSVYRARYPSRWTPDALEVETLSEQVERHYGFRLIDAWRDDLTLGELFELAQQAARASAVPRAARHA